MIEVVYMQLGDETLQPWEPVWVSTRGFKSRPRRQTETVKF